MTSRLRSDCPQHLCAAIAYVADDLDASVGCNVTLPAQTVDGIILDDFTLRKGIFK